MKHLKKHPKQQRMEDMTFPLQKVDPNPKSLGFAVAIKKSLDDGTKPKKHNLVVDSPVDEWQGIVIDRSSPAYKEKVIWEGREWLRSINDPNHERRMVGLMCLMLAVLYAVAIYALV